MAVLGRGRPNSARIIWAATFAIPEVTGDSSQTLDDYAMAASGTGAETSGADHPYGGSGAGSRTLFTPHPRPAPTQPKSKPVPVLPALVHGSARLSLAALSSTADGFYDIGPVIEADDEDFLLNFLETV